MGEVPCQSMGSLIQEQWRESSGWWQEVIMIHQWVNAKWYNEEISQEQHENFTKYWNVISSKIQVNE